MNQSLRELGADEVSFVDDFDWGGANSHDARRRGSAKLCREVLRKVQRNAGANVFLVAHSHGGNLTLRAVNQSRRLRQVVRGVICIATPFLSFSERRRPVLAMLPAAVDVARTVATSLLTALPGWFGNALMRALFATLLYMVWRWLAPASLTASYLEYCAAWPFCGQLLLWCLAIACVLSAAHLAYAGCKGAWSEAVTAMGPGLAAQKHRIFRRFGYVQPLRYVEGLPILSLSSGFDEARVGLTGAWWVHILSGAAIRFAVLIALVAAGALVAVLSMAGVLAQDFLRPHGWIYEVSKLVLGLLMLLAVVAIVLVFRWFVHVLVPLAARTSWGAGLPNPDQNLLLYVHARRELTEVRTCEHRRYTSMELLSAPGLLFHSSIYSHAGAIADMAAWMMRVASGNFPVQRMPTDSHSTQGEGDAADVRAAKEALRR